MKLIIFLLMALTSLSVTAAKDLKTLEINPSVNLSKLGWNAYFSERGLANAPMTVLEHTNHKGLRGFYSKEFRPLENESKKKQQSFLEQELDSYCKDLDKAYKLKQGKAELIKVNNQQVCRISFSENNQKTTQYIKGRINKSKKSYSLDIITFALTEKKYARFEGIISELMEALL